MFMLTIRPGTTSCLAASKLNFSVLFCKLLDQYVEAFLYPGDCSCPGYLSTEVSPGCRAGVARCSQAGTQIWTIATQLTYHTEQEHRESPIQALWGIKCSCHD